MSTVILRGARVTLRQWRDDDRADFATLNADPIAMEHFLGPLNREESDAMVERIRTSIEERGWGFWCLEIDGRCAGFTGLNMPNFDAPFMPAVEIGWRLQRPLWGRGYATEAARLALDYGFGTLALKEIVAFTAVANQRSRAVMDRLGMMHNPADDFDHPRVPVGHRIRRHVLYRLSAPAS
jgi:RimJ/RimL family protein N-acetyltransferase